MSVSVKRIGAILAAAVLALTPLIGCGANTGTNSAVNTVVDEVPKQTVVRDTTTPDGALMARLDALIAGDFSGLPGFDQTQLEQLSIGKEQIQGIVSAFFGKNTYNVSSVTAVNDEQAQVHILGKSVNMSRFLPVFMSAYMAKYTEYAVNNDIENVENQTVVRDAMITIITDTAKEKQASAQLKDVSATISMKKNGNTWDVDTTDNTNANQLVELVMGSTQEELVQGVKNLLGSFSTTS